VQRDAIIGQNDGEEGKIDNHSEHIDEEFQVQHIRSFVFPATFSSHIDHVQQVLHHCADHCRSEQGVLDVVCFSVWRDVAQQ
jgi:hypothetical protein